MRLQIAGILLLVGAFGLCACKSSGSAEPTAEAYPSMPEPEEDEAETQAPWLTEQDDQAGIRVRAVDSDLAIYFVADAKDRAVIMAHGKASRTVSGDWSTTDSTEAIRALAEASGLDVLAVEAPETKAGDEESRRDWLLIGPGDIQRDQPSLEGPFDEERRLTAAFLAAKLTDLIKLLAHESDIRPEYMRVFGFVTVVGHSLPIGHVFNAVVRLSDLEVEQRTDRWMFSDSDLPHPDRYASGSRLCEPVEHWMDPAIRADLEDVRLAGVAMGPSPQVLLMTDDATACMLGEGDTFSSVTVEAHRRWRVTAVERDRVVLTEIDGDGRIEHALSTEK